jgi:hypothetical protein
MQEILKIAKDTNKINENPYFKNLNKDVQLKLFLNSQEAFISAIDNWSKVLGLMISKVPSDLQRAVLIDNLNDEQGMCNCAFSAITHTVNNRQNDGCLHRNGDLTKSHVNTFRMLLVSLDYTEKIQLYNRYLPSYRYVKKFNDDLTNSIGGIIKIDGINWIYNIAILGMIEYVYVDVSKYIHAYLCNFLPPDKINHYSTHEILDVHHYTSLFQLLEPYIKTNYNEIYFGICRGFKLMDELYFSLNYFLAGVISKL